MNKCTKKGLNNAACSISGNLLSMGFGFVEFKTRASAQKAIKTLQHSKLDDHQLELKVSNKSTMYVLTVNILNYMGKASMNIFKIGQAKLTNVTTLFEV